MVGIVLIAIFDNFFDRILSFQGTFSAIFRSTIDDEIAFMKLFDDATFLPVKVIFDEEATCAKFGDYFSRCFNIVKVDDFKLKSPVEVYCSYPG